MKHQASREAFSTRREMDFFSEKDLIAQTGHNKHEWPLVIVEELVDNALDACEEAGTAPEIGIIVDEQGIEVQDNGPGIPPEVVAGIVDFSRRISSREAYVAPDRGAQGNALKTLVAIPYVLHGTGKVEIESRGIRHEIRLRLDEIKQLPVIDHQQSPTSDRTMGTRFRVYWPNSTEQQTAA